MAELKFNVDGKFEKTLDDLVDSNKDVTTKADVVQRAVATYKYFRNIPDGAKIQVIDDQGQVLVQNVQVP